jgi:hypothetical protein
VSNLGRLLRGQWGCHAECVLQLDGLLGGLDLRHDRVWGGLGQGLLQLLELYSCHHSVGCLTALPITVNSPSDVSPEGDDTTRPWYLQDQVGIVWNCHKLGECQLSEESVVCSFKIGNLKRYGLRAEIFSSPEGYGKGYLTNGGHCCTRDYVMERSLTGVQQRP